MQMSDFDYSLFFFFARRFRQVLVSRGKIDDIIVSWHERGQRFVRFAVALRLQKKTRLRGLRTYLSNLFHRVTDLHALHGGPRVSPGPPDLRAVRPEVQTMSAPNDKLACSQLGPSQRSLSTRPLGLFVSALDT